MYRKYPAQLGRFNNLIMLHIRIELEITPEAIVEAVTTHMANRSRSSSVTSLASTVSTDSAGSSQLGDKRAQSPESPVVRRLSTFFSSSTSDNLARNRAQTKCDPLEVTPTTKEGSFLGEYFQLHA